MTDPGGLWDGRFVGILLVGLALRIAVLIYAGLEPDLFDFPDTHRYLRVARNIAEGCGPIESDVVRAGTDPLYPSILSIPYHFRADADGAAFHFGRCVNLLCGLCAIGLLGDLTRRLFGRAAAHVACSILAIDPIMLFFHGLVLTEVPYIALLLAGCCGLVRLRDSHRVSTAMWAGMLLGLAVLLRSDSVLMPLVLLPFVWHFAGRHRSEHGLRRMVATAVFLLAAGLMLTPTIARNYCLFGHFVPVRIGAGASLLEALGSWADGGPGMDRIVYPKVPDDADEYERDRVYREAAWAWAQTHPRESLRLAWSKLRRTWSISMNAENYSSWKYDAVCWLTVAPVFGFAIAGVWIMRRHGWELALLLLPAAYFTLLHVVFVGSVRYRLPAMPFVFVLAAVAAMRLPLFKPRATSL